MSDGVNKVILVGNLGRDPESQYLQGGTAVTKFSVATSKSWKDKTSGQKQERTEWHNIVTFARLAEVCAQYLKQGSKVYIEGELKTSSWDDKESGQKRYRTEIVAETMRMLGGGPQANPAQQAPPYQQPAGQQNTPPPNNQQAGYQNPNGTQKSPYAANPPPPNAGGFDDDIPF